MSQSVKPSLNIDTEPHLSWPLENGDIINIDITVYLNGYHGDTSQGFLVGNVVSPLWSLSTTLPNSHIYQGPTRPWTCTLHQPCPQSRYQRLWSQPSIQRHWESLKPHPYSISSQFGSHHIGKVFHSEPHILHLCMLLDILCLILKLMCDAVNHEPSKMQAGDCFTIEVHVCTLYTLWISLMALASHW